MSLKKVHDNQPESFEFTDKNLELANNILKKSEEKIRGVKSSYTEMIITVVRPKWKKEMTMKGCRMSLRVLNSSTFPV